MSAVKQANSITSGDLMSYLRARYAPPSFAFLPQVANGTGTHRSRTADALAMSLWPSRGLELHGLEIKISRGDWLRELKEPAKADAVAKFCDRWWIVTPSKDIVKPVELPKGWGLIVLRGEKLVGVVEASLIETQPVSRSFLAAVLRVAASPGQKEIADASQTGYKLGYEAGQKNVEHSRQSGQREEDTARKAIAEFEAASGIEINEWQAGRIGAAVKLVMDNQNRPEQVRRELVYLQQQLKRVSDVITRELEGECQS